MSFELRKLEDVCDILDHMRIPITSRDRKEGPYPYYGANGIQDYIDDYIFDDELVLLAEDGGNFGSKEKPIAYRISGKTWVNNHAHVLKPKNIIDVDYLCYSLMYYDVSGLVNGATRQKLTQSEMRKINIRYRSLEKQRQMVFEIKLISNIISSREHQLSNLNLLVKSRFIEMFGDPYYNPKGWKSDYLGNYMTTLTDFSANGSYEILDSNVVMYDEPNYAIMVRTTDLEKGDLTGELKYIDEKAYNLLSKSKLYGGELIMSKIGSAGKIYLMPFINKPASLGRNAFMFRFNECINIVFLYTLLNTDYGTNMIQQHVRGAVTKTITKESTRKLLIYVPPIELQNQFADFVAQVDKSKLAIQQSLYELETLKKSLMQQYFG